MAKISVYDRLETNFTHNGLVLPDVIYCPVEEELNSKYVLELTHPIDEKGKWEYLVEENIIKADGQLFRIHSTESNLSYIYVYARHIFYDLLHNFLEDVRPTNMNGAGALNWILTHTQHPHNFIGMSDIDTLNTQYYIRKNPVEAMLGSDSLVTRWNGELVRDNYTIKLLSQRGQNKGTQIAYAKNMLGLEVKRDMDTVITRIMPVGREGLLLPEKYIDSPLITNYTFPHIRKVEFDIGVDEETTEEQAYEKLRQGAKNLYEINKVDIPYVNINANLLLLEHTEEYKHLKNLVRVELGDTISCTDNPLKITFEAKVIRIKKDVLSNRNVEVELGQFKKGISNTIQNAINEISEELKQNTSDLEKAIENATELLTNALGGYVTKRPGEILIMDTEDINTATEVWRWNLNGLGYSGTGINGPYRLAITMDGKINADFIITGTMNAGIVKTGILASKDNSIWINLDSNNFNFKDQLIWDGQQDKLILGEKTIISWDSVDNKPWIPQDAEDVGARPDDWVPSWSEIQSKPTILSADDIKTTVITKDWIGTLGLMVGEEIQMGSDATISWANVSNKPWIPSTAEDVGARPDDWVPSWSEIQSKPTILSADDIKTTVITKDWIGTLGLMVGEEIQMGSDATISWANVSNKPWIPSTAEDVGARPDDWVPSWSEIQSKPTILSADDIKTTVITKDWIGTLGLMVGEEIQMGSDATISWANVSNKPSIPTTSQITQITEDTIITTNVEATNLKVRSANITGELVARAVSTQSIRGDTQLEMWGNNMYFFDLGGGSEIGSLGTQRYSADVTGIVLGAYWGSGWALGHDGYDIISYKPQMGNDFINMKEETYFWDNVEILENLYVSGRKNGLHKTENYGGRLVSAYETAEYFYGDIGSGRINDDGECLIHIDEIFQECVNTNINYHVFIQKYNGSINRIEKESLYFIVYGEPNTEFSWELKAKRKGYEEDRLVVPDGSKNIRPSNIVETNTLEESEEDVRLQVLLNGVLDFNLANLLLNEEEY